MLGFICLFFPAIISVYISSYLKKKKVDLNFLLLNYSIYLISINFVITCVLTFIFNNPNSQLQINSFNNTFAIKYFSLSILLCILLPFMFEKLSKRYNIGNSLEIFTKNIIKLRKKIREEKKLNYIFNIGLIIVFFIFFNLFITTLLFIFKINMSYFNFIIACGLTILLSIFIMKKENYSLKRIVATISIVAVIICLSIFISGKTYDQTWDGNSYHKTAIGQLKNGWNPVYETIEDFNDSSDNPLKINNSYGIWNNHYAKGYWMYAANVYKITNNIESGKSILLLAGIGCFLLCFSYLAKKMKLLYSIIISFLIVFNPVYYVQISTFYNDGLVYLFLTILILSLTKICDQNDSMSYYKKYILYISTLVILINIKFTSFAYAGIYSLGYYIYFIINSKLRKENLKKMTMSATVAVIIGIFIVGLSTYPKNYKMAGHVFYPLFGKDKVDIMTVNQPKSFEHLSGIEKFLIANFSETDNIIYVYDREPKLKIPFSIHREEFSHLATTDTRIGGYGILFSGILIFSVITIGFVLFKVFKKNKNTFWIFAVPLLSTLFLVFILDDSWWARYFPQLYWVPLISIILLALYYHKLKFKVFNTIMMLLMLLNLGFFHVESFPVKYESYKDINNGFAELVNQYNSNKKIYVYTRNFDGIMYNIKDRITNFEIINNIDEFNKSNYQQIPNIYSNLVEVFVEL